jgi:hypothetical protein
VSGACRQRLAHLTIAKIAKKATRLREINFAPLLTEITALDLSGRFLVGPSWGRGQTPDPAGSKIDGFWITEMCRIGQRERQRVTERYPDKASWRTHASREYSGGSGLERAIRSSPGRCLVSRAQDIAVLLRAAQGLLAEALKMLDSGELGSNQPTASEADGNARSVRVVPTELDALRARRALQGAK